MPEGGHAGFLEGPWGRRSWAERRALAFLHRHLSGFRLSPEFGRMTAMSLTDRHGLPTAG